MRIASNALRDLIAFYHSELNLIYESPEIDALLYLVLEHYSGLSKTDVLNKKNANLNQSDLLKLYFCCKELKKNVPVQYILKEAWFYDLKFYVDEHVLIPRPETEELVDLILKENKTASSFLDIGTGSGCIPVTIKTKLPNSLVSACDISSAALSVARKNSEIHNSKINFIEADVLNIEAASKKISSAFNVIVSNPPYIMENEKDQMTKQVLDYEPHLALFVDGEDEIIFYKKIIDLCKHTLNANGKLYFELNPLTADTVLNYARQSRIFSQADLLNDMSGKQRFLRAVKIS